MKAARNCFVIKKCFKFSSTYSKQLLFTSYVHSHLEFGSAMWNPCSKGLINDIEKIQCKASKTFASVSNVTYINRLKSFGMLTLYNRCIATDLCFMYKLIQWQVPNLELSDLNMHLCV